VVVSKAGHTFAATAGPSAGAGAQPANPEPSEPPEG
jgi:hypothetical protein